jgi:hypothetical protein
MDENFEHVLCQIDKLFPEKKLLTRRAVVKVFQKIISPDFNQSAFRRMQLNGNVPQASTLVKRKLYHVEHVARFLIDKGYLTSKQ